MDRDVDYLLDILTSSRMIRSYVGDATRQEFLTDTKLQDSVIRRIEIIGEAAGRVSSAFREENSEIPWSEIRGMRNRMIHVYDDIDMDIVWETVQQDLPLLISRLEKLTPPES